MITKKELTKRLLETHGDCDYDLAFGVASYIVQYLRYESQDEKQWKKIFRRVYDDVYAMLVEACATYLDADSYMCPNKKYMKDKGICDECQFIRWKENKTTCQPYCIKHKKDIFTDNESCEDFIRSNGSVKCHVK